MDNLNSNLNAKLIDTFIKSRLNDFYYIYICLLSHFCKIVERAIGRGWWVGGGGEEGERVEVRVKSFGNLSTARSEIAKIWERFESQRGWNERAEKSNEVDEREGGGRSAGVQRGVWGEWSGWVAIHGENASRAGLVSDGQAGPPAAAFSVKWMLVITAGEGSNERVGRAIDGGKETEI